MKKLYLSITILLILITLHLKLQILAKSPCEKYVIGAWNGGIGIALTAVLNQLAYCESTNKTPVVYWGANSRYYPPGHFNGRTGNAWDYYFEPTSQEVYKPNDKIHIYGQANFSYYYATQEKRDHAHQLIKKYIKINPMVQKKIDQFYNEFMANEKNIIGIHLRGTDKYKEDKPVTTEKFFETACKYADKDTVFLIASDDQKLFGKMTKLLDKRKVIYYNCYRSTNNIPLHVPVKRPSLAQLGEDVIVEMWLLAKCDLFIHSFSNISSIVLYLNPLLKNIHLK